MPVVLVSVSSCLEGCDSGGITYRYFQTHLLLFGSCCVEGLAEDSIQLLLEVSSVEYAFSDHRWIKGIHLHLSIADVGT